MLSKCCGKCERVEQAHRREFLISTPPKCEVCGTPMVRVNVMTLNDQRRMWILALKFAFKRNPYLLYR
jgi:NAD-dependent SIR2 family protein deacetylase